MTSADSLPVAPPPRAGVVFRLWLLILGGSILQKFVPMTRWGHLLGTLGPANVSSHPGPPPPPSEPSHSLAVAITRACRWIPWTPTCLAQAFAGQRLLIARETPGQITIGLRPEGPTKWPAHAWLIVDGYVITGAIEKEVYFPAASYRFIDPSGQARPIRQQSL